MQSGSFETMIADWGTPVTGGVGLATCTLIVAVALTYLISTINGSITVRYRSGRSKPPTLPYAFPLLGHLPEFLWNIENFFTKATTRYGADVPVRIQLLNRRMSFLTGPSNVRSLFKSSRDLSSEHWLVQVLVNAFGVEAADAPFYLADDTGIARVPEPGSRDLNPQHRIFYLVYKSVHDGLSGARLAEMERQLVGNLSEQIADAGFSFDTWTELPDLYGSLIRGICFRASTISLCGSRILDVIPTFDQDFWDFDSHLPSLFKEMPPWLAPSSFKARNKMKENIKQWHSFAHQHYDVSKGEEDPRDWEEFFGSRLMRTRHEFFQKMPLSKDTLAADDLGLIWAATANAIPAIGWMILEVLQRPALLATVRQEVAPFVSEDSSKPGRMIVDIDGLCSQTLVQSIYAEVLRVHNGTLINRVPRSPNFTIGGWQLAKGEPIIVSTYHTARDASVWNAGTVDDPHPVDTFWPERFIVDPGKRSSGPVVQTPPIRKQQPVAPEPSSPRFSLDGTDGSWVPYGGGSRMCPGRHFAKKELIVTMAMFLMAFDIELLTEPGSYIKNDMKFFMFGVMHPMGTVPARIRRRKF